MPSYVGICFWSLLILNFCLQNDLLESAKPFQDDPAKQERFEQFLKEKYHGGLRPKDGSGASNMSEAARARERLEFESVAETINKGNHGKESVPPSELFSSTLATAGLQFTSGGAEVCTLFNS